MKFRNAVARVGESFIVQLVMVNLIYFFIVNLAWCQVIKKSLDAFAVKQFEKKLRPKLKIYNSHKDFGRIRSKYKKSQFVRTGAGIASEDSKMYLKMGTGFFITNKMKREGVYDRVKPKGLPMLQISVGFLGAIEPEISIQVRKLKYEDVGTYNTHIIQKISSYNLFFNTNYNLINSKLFNFYITAGLGGAINNAGVTLIRTPNSKNKNLDIPGKVTNNFAWNVGFGIKRNLYKKIDIDLSYKYINLGQIQSRKYEIGKYTINPSTQKLSLHEIGLFVVYRI